MNKKAKIAIIIIVALVVFISVVPIPTGVYKDGGTRTYTALTYKVVKWHRLSGNGDIYEKTSVYWFPNNFKSLDELFNSDKQSKSAEMQNDRSIELLQEQYPEYFELSDFKLIEVYVWETAEGTYRCGMMSGTNRMKTAPEIRALEEKSLSIAETKMVLEEIGVENDSITVIPITQPYMNNANDNNISEPYIINEEIAEQIYKLFMK